MSRIEQIVMDYFNHNDLNLYNLIKFLEQNDTIRYQIYREMEQKYHEEDVQNAIDEYNEDHETNHEFTATEIRQMAERFDDCMTDYSNWHEIIMNIVNDWCGDKEIDDGQLGGVNE